MPVDFLLLQANPLLELLDELLGRLPELFGLRRALPQRPPAQGGQQGTAVKTHFLLQHTLFSRCVINKTPMKSTPSIKGFLTTKKLLDQDKKALSKDASQKSLSRASVRLKNFEDVLDGRTPTRNNFQ